MTRGGQCQSDIIKRVCSNCASCSCVFKIPDDYLSSGEPNDSRMRDCVISVSLVYYVHMSIYLLWKFLFVPRLLAWIIDTLSWLCFFRHIDLYCNCVNLSSHLFHVFWSFIDYRIVLTCNAVAFYLVQVHRFNAIDLACVSAYAFWHKI